MYFAVTSTSSWLLCLIYCRNSSKNIQRWINWDPISLLRTLSFRWASCGLRSYILTDALLTCFDSWLIRIKKNYHFYVIVLKHQSNIISHVLSEFFKTPKNLGYGFFYEVTSQCFDTPGTWIHQSLVFCIKSAKTNRSWRISITALLIEWFDWLSCATWRKRPSRTV